MHLQHSWRPHISALPSSLAVHRQGTAPHGGTTRASNSISMNLL